MRHGPTRLSTRAYSILPLLAAAWLATAGRPAPAEEPEYPASRLGMRTAPLLLLSRPDVRADLRLDAKQAASAERTITELWIQAAALRGRTGPEAVAARRSIDQAQRAWIDSQLDEAQRHRLAQIDLQWEGASALVSRPPVAEALDLTPEQTRSLERLVGDHARQRTGKPSAGDDEQAFSRKALDVLTPDQRGRWLTMLGPPFVPQVAAAPGASARK